MHVRRPGKHTPPDADGPGAQQKGGWLPGCLAAWLPAA